MTLSTSICIPRIESSVTKEYVKHKIQELQIGNIVQIREIPLYNDAAFKRIIIHIKWLQTPRSTDIQKKIEELGSIKVVHDMPWYWKVVAAR